MGSNGKLSYMIFLKYFLKLVYFVRFDLMFFFAKGFKDYKLDWEGVNLFFTFIPSDNN